MVNTNEAFVRKTTVLTILLIAYFISSLFHSDLWGNILSPINAFTAGGILCFAYLKSDRTIRVSLTLLMYSFACFAWGIADTLWAIMSYNGVSPESSPVIWIFYVLTNIFLLSSLFILAVEQFKKWNLVQYSIDFMINSLMTIFLFWILFLHKDMSILQAFLASDFTSILSLLTDILICISIFSWFLSVRSGKIPSFMRIISFGLVLFALVDIIYYYIDYNKLYVPNGLADFAYIATLYIISLGALWETYKSRSTFDLSAVANTGGRMRWIYLIFYPIFAFLFSETGLVDISLSTTDIIFFTVPIMLYWGFCKYVQVSIEKEVILKHQKKILEQRVADQINELTFLANQDTLTTLFNRRYFISLLDDSIQSRGLDDLLAIMMIDLDRFKTVNDIYGHDIGDQLLIELSYRMIEWDDCEATFARLGGDEFAVMFRGKYTQKDIEEFCIQLINMCSKPVNIGNVSLNPTISVGIALVSENIRDWKTLMKHADIAMYSAKSQGCNKYQFYDPIIDEVLQKNAETETLVKRANIETDFKLFYQPQYSLPDLQLVGAEPLVYLNNREHGFIPPTIFIPITEEIDYIFKFGKKVMQETIHQSKIWNTKFPIRPKVGFNISPKQFEDEEFLKLLETLISSGDLNPDYIEAKIAKSTIKDRDHGENIFKMLKELVISISIDDFDPGYSILSYIGKYPFDRLKLDKSLIDNVSSKGSVGTNIVKAAIDMAHSTGIRTIAEGVENKDQLETLMKLGCDQVQGHLLGRPVPTDMFEERYIKKGLADISTIIY